MSWWAEAWPVLAGVALGGITGAHLTWNISARVHWRRGYDEGRADQQMLEQAWPTPQTGVTPDRSNGE